MLAHDHSNYATQNGRKELLRQAIQEYANSGLRPLLLAPQDKNPIHKNWSEKPPEVDDLLALVNDHHNIGILLGKWSGYLVDVDIDDEVALRLADYFLPPTEAVFGRRSAPASHRLYRCDPLPQSIAFRFFNKTLVEIRADSGKQTMFPPSIHPVGEVVEWVRKFQSPQGGSETRWLSG